MGIKKRSSVERNRVERYRLKVKRWTCNLYREALLRNISAQIFLIQKSKQPNASRIPEMHR